MAPFHFHPAGLLAALALMAGLSGPAAADHGPGVPLGPAVGAAFGPDGVLWRVMAEQGALRVDRSTDQGRSFADPVHIDARSAPPRVHPEDAPQLLVARDRILVAWPGLVAGRPRAMVSESVDGGRSFSAPRPVAGSGKGSQIRVILAPGGAEPRILFLDPAGGRPGGRLYTVELDRSPDRQSPVRSLAGETCECCRLDSAVAPDGSLVVLSRMIFPGGVRDFGLIRTVADGPARVIRAPADDWRIDACPEHGGALAIGRDGGYHLTWFTQGRQRQGAFYARGGADGDWSVPVALGDPGRLPGHADVLILGDQVYLAWQEFDGQELSIHGMASADGGRRFEAPRRLAGTRSPADYPRLVTDGRQAFVSWYARDPGYQLLALPAPGAGGARPTPAATPPPGPAPTLAFGRDSLAAITAARKGQPFLLVMWSIDCGPCLKELREFAAIQATGRELPLVLVSTDDRARTDEVAATLARFGLENLESWIFADENHQQLRYAVDPRWYGELPRGYFYGADGSRKAHSGGLTREQIEAWLATPTVAL